MPEYVTIQDAADRLSVSPKTVRRFIACGALPAFKVGPTPVGRIRDIRPVRIPVGAIDALLHPIVGSAA